MLPRKTGKPIAFKCTEELRQQTEAIADSLGESLSDYVRRAVEERNASQHSNPQRIGSTKYIEEVNTKPTIPELKEKVKEMEKPAMVKSFMKGGK